MTDAAVPADLQDWHNLADQFSRFDDYPAVIRTYEAAISHYPDERSLYWHYGLALLLNQQPEEAQTNWLMVLAEADDEALWLAELQQVLQQAVSNHIAWGHQSAVWQIRQCLRELHSGDAENLLHLIILAVEHQTLTIEMLFDWSIVEVVQHSVIADQALLLCALERYLSVAFPHPITAELTAALVPHIQDAEAIADLILVHSQRIGHIQRYSALAQDLLQIGLQRSPQHFESLLAYSSFAQQEYDYPASIQASQQAVAIATSPMAQIVAMNALLCSLLASGQRDASFQQLLQDYRQCLVTNLSQLTLDRTDAYRLLVSTVCLPYVEDLPQPNRALQNQVVQLCERAFQAAHQSVYDRYQLAHQNRPIPEVSQPLKVGYVCRYFYQHSVGWLARWLLKNHHADQIELYIYIVNPQATPDSVQQQYLQLSEHVSLCPFDALQIAAQIHQDNVDILVELDSLTCEVTCEVMALKPAPIQVSWLGWDASGLAAIDYFMADSYVLPDNAQGSYPEKIVRLPQTYIAVEGFEVGVPTLHRAKLGIPDDAIVFMTAQRGYKRHPDMMQRQLQILQQVPNSYLLIKGIADQAVVQTAFLELAVQLEISEQRLIFLPLVADESMHRANLTIADVILDTYPYNGATTTLEALWMERPIVTRVGEQFAARNSYTMLKNVGVEAGIAWTDTEYVEWGVRLGTDAQLRQQVTWQLRQSKQMAPLWDAAKFAQSVETAYETMWQTFQQRQIES
ncbi:O-linked N-acetylglucosamine transferase, SPINDLY family protein [filamentous cyanobacterium LEGE 11480]|uniref:O-linked N-acetylglucosamine transferase, SPINDLY family protein n=1 Tax=Romeriopsis navalis LEGE 11480 TaxID=2777977 RepID=A0A928VR66_9CYAN|nr:O-linked N-acetylglucosamine transferase, SPINDLY family protein [Romeriopsis navalis]MBE9031451.1 O-linked N-acetylglucosamine transferase, SPINDLY family protein [Romeriopsis navalis LEGE 11480]